MHRVILVLLLALASAAPARSQQLQAPPREAPAPSPEKVLDAPYLHNVIRLHEKVLSGGQPYGDAGFKRLQELGVRTVISVDGARPDVRLARKYGLRYVHLPHGYDGVPADRAGELAKAVRDLDGPIYIHCHHGKHRSPAAAAVACVGAGLIAPAGARPVLETAGTSKNYRGLYESAERARPLDAAMLDALQVEFREVAEIPIMADAMVAIEHRHDHLKQVAANGWQRLADHPDVAPAHEALMLREHLTELLRTDDVQGQAAEFRQLLAEGEQHAQRLEDALRAGEKTSDAGGRQRLDGLLQAVTQNCTQCHTEFRDVPLDEKPPR